MKFFKNIFLLSVIALSIGGRLAYADQTPKSDPYDSRMRVIAYNAGQVVHLSTVVGATMVIEFNDNETVTSVAEADSKSLMAMPKGNYLFLKPTAILPLQPVIVLTTLPSGALRQYTFEFETINSDSTANGAEGVYYSVEFTYPQQEAEAEEARTLSEEAQTAKLNAAAEAQAQLTAANGMMAEERTNPDIGPRNYKYVAKGDHVLAPISIWDNGYSTDLTFAGNVSMPSIFVINSDGTEATADYSVHGNSIIIDQTAKEIRLRLGDDVLNIYNRAYNQVGGNPETGTVSPDVTRVLNSNAGTVP